MIEHALTRGAVFRIATGAWAEAASAAQEALLLDRNLGLDELVAFPLAELAVIAALRGDPHAPARLEELEAALDAAPAARRRRPAWSPVWRTGPRRVSPTCRPATALHHLEQIDLPVVRGLAALDRVETAAARRPARPRRAVARASCARSPRAPTWRGRGPRSTTVEAVLGGPDAEERLPAGPGVARAVLHGSRPGPAPSSRSGEYLRRHRRRTDAREPLREALDTFETLGAGAWAERARQELRASGETARRGADLVATELTPSEEQIAALVRQGLSNKEVAGRLFVSPRTVDFHLRNVYTKLGITSRTELAAMALDPR